jgi:hypothetical protein
MVTKHFSGGHMRNAKSLGDTLRLGSLAGTGWAYEEKTHSGRLPRGASEMPQPSIPS